MRVRRPAARRLAFAGALLLGVAPLLAGCPSEGEKAPVAERVCESAQALSAQPITGSSLANKQLSLTFDDGPGARTSELSTYLKNHGIRAAFFVNGHCFGAGNPCGNPLPAATILAQLVADGHVVANHTQTHRNLISPRPAANVVVQELADTDAIIAPYVASNRFLFRAPFGAWDPTAYDALKDTSMNKYVGPIDWNMGDQLYPAPPAEPQQAADWDCWDHAYTSKACGDLYLKEIAAEGKGIVLMHDPYPVNEMGNDDILNGKGNTVVMVKYIVGELEKLGAAGYTYKRVDEVPAIDALLPPLPPPPKDAGSDAAADAGADAGPDGDSGTGTGTGTGGDSGTGAGGDSGTGTGAGTDAGTDPCAPRTAGSRARPGSH